MTIWIYRLTAAPILTLGAFLVAPFHAKLRAALRAKMKVRGEFNPEFPPIWIHAASGEFEYAKPVIREIKLRAPRVPIIVTYSSSTYARAIESFPGVDLAVPAPLDLPGPLLSFLRRTRPRMLLVARTDLWPEMLHQARAFQIPIVLFAYTQRDPRRMHWIARQLRGWLLGAVNQVLCVTEDDASNVRALGATATVGVLGDTRYDQVQFRLQNPKALPLHLKPARPALVAGSTWPEDEAVLIEALTAPLKAGKLQLILVPHEPTPSHIHSLRGNLERDGLTWSLYSAEQAWQDSHVLIVDKIGVLAELYQWAEIAFVGGSFKSSVHSVMEPLGAGCATLVGPHFGNNREAQEFSRVSVGPVCAVQPCAGAADLARAVENLLADENRAARRERILAAFRSRLGSSRRLCEQLIAESPTAGPRDARGLSPRS